MESICCIKETKNLSRGKSDVSFGRRKETGKYDKIKIRLLKIRDSLEKVFYKLYEIL